MSLEAIRKNIWENSGKSVEVINKAKEGFTGDPSTIHYWECISRRVSELVQPAKRKKRPKIDPTTTESKARYRRAKWDYEAAKYPDWIKGDSLGSYFIEPDYPDCGTSNGLTDWVMSYIKWSGGRATRVSSAGRQLPGGKFIPSTTRKGAADVSSTIRGKSIMWEIKAGADKPSPAQLKEQAKERSAGGEYFFVHNAEEFFVLFDSLFVQKELFS